MTNAIESSFLFFSVSNIVSARTEKRRSLQEDRGRSKKQDDLSRPKGRKT